MRICVNLWFVILLAAVCGCGKHSGTLDRLERARVVMEEHPDSALAILAQIDTASLASERERALYGLYLTNARYLAYDPSATDSLLAANSAYLSSAPSAYDRMLYHYLSGLFQSEDSLFSSALPHLLQASDLAKDLNDPLYMGRIHRTIGDVYNSLFIDKQALKYHVLALDDFILGKEDKFVGWQKWTVAQSYYNLGVLDSCYLLLNDIMSDSINRDNDDIKNAAYRLMGAAKKKEEKYEEAITSIRRVSEPLNTRDNYIISYSWYKLGHLDSAKCYFQQLKPQSPGQIPVHDSMKPSGRPRQEVAPIDVYYQNGQIWFSFDEDDCGGISVNLTHVATGQTVIDYVTDSTPIAITLPSGTISIVCIDDNGITYTGQIAI